MPKRRGGEKDSFPVIVTLAIFHYDEIQKISKVGLVEDGYGKFGLPELQMPYGESSQNISEKIASKYVEFNESNAIDLRLTHCLDKPNRYPGDAKQHVSLVYRLNLGSDSKIKEGISFLDADSLAEVFEDNLIVKDHKNIIRLAFFNA